MPLLLTSYSFINLTNKLYDSWLGREFFSGQKIILFDRKKNIITDIFAWLICLVFSTADDYMKFNRCILFFVKLH